MSDDLVRRWEPYTDEGNYYNYGNMEECSDGYYIEYQDYKDAADRIEELEAKVEGANSIIASERAEVLALRRKLAKAVEALERIGSGEFSGQVLTSMPPQDAAAFFARTTLAELKGQDDE